MHLRRAHASIAQVPAPVPSGARATVLRSLEFGNLTHALGLRPEATLSHTITLRSHIPFNIRPTVRSIHRKQLLFGGLGAGLTSQLTQGQFRHHVAVLHGPSLINVLEVLSTELTRALANLLLRIPQVLEHRLVELWCLRFQQSNGILDWGKVAQYPDCVHDLLRYN